MAVTTSPRLGITRWSDDADEYTREQRDADNALLDELTAIDEQGLIAARGAAGTRGRYYYATDTQRLYRDDGTAWREVALYRATVTKGEVLLVGDDALNLGELDIEARLVVTSDSEDLTGVQIIQQADGTGPDDAAAALAVRDPASLFARGANIYSDGGYGGGRSPSRQGAFFHIKPHKDDERGIYVDHTEDVTADLLRASTDGTRRFSVDNKGRIYLSALSDNSAPGTPGGAGVIYCNTVGDLLYKSPSGNVRTLALH